MNPSTKRILESNPGYADLRVLMGGAMGEFKPPPTTIKKDQEQISHLGCSSIRNPSQTRHIWDSI